MRRNEPGEQQQVSRLQGKRGEQMALKRMGATIRERRKTLDISRAELAARAELDLSYIGKLERGLSSPGAETILRLAGALDFNPSDLWRGVRLELPDGRRGPGVWIVDRAEGAR